MLHEYEVVESEDPRMRHLRCGGLFSDVKEMYFHDCKGPENEWLTIKEVATLTRSHVQTIYSAINRGHLTPQVHDIKRIHIDDVMAWLKRRFG